MNKQNQQGFALLDVLLAVILVCVASYGVYTMAKGYHLSSSMRTLEQRAITIAQNYTPFLQDATSSSSGSAVLSGNELSTDFLTSIGIPSSALCNDSSDYTYVQTSSYYTDGSGTATQSIFNFDQEVGNSSESGASYLMIGFMGSGAQVNQLAQDISQTFSVYYGSSGGSITNTADSLVSSSDTSNDYAIYLFFPKMSDITTAPFKTVDTC